MSRARWGVAAVALAVGIGAALYAGWPTAVEDRAHPEDGERLYRQGLLPSGEPVRAVVMGDVPMVGDQVPCGSCHGRSGMGTGESGSRTPPIAGPLLFAADARKTRPAYTDALVLRAVREGVDSAGQPLLPLMPRYALSDADGAALVAYLRSLGASPSPGVDDDTLHFATVLADDVDPAVREDVSGVIRAFVDAKNAETRNDGARSKARRAPGEALDPYRAWSLQVWEVHGPASGWRAELEARYAAEPVFALVGGVAAGSWQPVHEFCEDHGVPCLLPSTDRPGTPAGYYTLYYSGGLRLEAEILAADLAASGAMGDVVQLVDAGDDAELEAAATLATRLEGAGGHTRLVTLGPDGAVPVGSAVVAWIRDPARLTGAGEGPLLYLSSTLTGARWERVPEALRARSRGVDLFRSPSEADPALGRFRAWADARGVAVRSERLQAQSWFACMALLDGSKHVARYPQGDYLLDSLDHAAGLTALLPIYPRGTLGPGQRAFANGGRVLDLGGNEPPRWIVP